MLSAINNLFNNRVFFLTIAFTFLLILSESLTFNLGYSEVERLYYAGDVRGLLISFSLSLVVFSVTAFFIWSALVSGYDYKVIYFICFLLALLTEYGYQSALGRFSLPSDLGNAFFATDFGTKWSAMSSYFNWLALIPCLVFGLAVFTVKPKYKGGWKIFFLNVLVAASFFSLNVNFFDRSYVTPALAAYYKNLVAGSWYFFEDSNFTSPRAAPTFFSKETPKNNIVFIVDESVRADHLSLNGYERDTTPFLVELNKKGFIKNWGAAVSGTTESVNSNRLLLSGANELPDPSYNFNKITSIFQYAKAMGYKNFYFDGQMDCKWNGTRFDVEDFGTKVTIDDYETKSRYDIDREIAVRVNDILKNSEGNFIWINKMGVHVPYEKNYPENSSIWLPTDISAERSELINNNQPLINNYDNAIKYNSEVFFKNLLPEGVLNNTIYVYTSDHGQTLVQGKASHCGNTKNEALVPLFIISQPGLLSEADTTFRAAHANIFATLLDVMKYPERERKYDYSISLFKAKRENSAPRYYFSGSLTGGSGGELFLYDD